MRENTNHAGQVMKMVGWLMSTHEAKLQNNNIQVTET